MNFLAFTGIVNFITSLFIGFLIISRNLFSRRNFSFFILNLSVSIYSLGYFLWQSSTNYEISVFWFKILFLGIVSINVSYLFFVFSILEILNEKLNKLYVHCVVGIFFCYLNLTGHLYEGFTVKYNFGLWPIPTFYFKIYLVIWFYQCFYGFSWLLQGLKRAKGIELNQIKYFLIAALVGFGGGATNWPLWFGINFPPYLNLFVSLYLGIVAYAIIRFHLLDIKVALTRSILFFLVYIIVVGTPLYVGKILDNWQLATYLSLILATIGPFIYLYVQKRAEDALLQEQRRYQMTLRQASSGMSRIKDLKKLLKLIVHIVTRTVHIEHSSIYLYTDTEKKYLLEASRSRGRLDGNGVIERDSPLVEYLFDIREPIVYEEVKQRTQDYSDPRLQQVEATLRDLDAAVLVPIFIEERLLAIIILGKKTSGNLYSEDDLAVFSILANQAALAIENCRFWDAERKKMQEEGLMERMVSLDHMASSMAHEIDNPMSAIRTSLEYAQYLLSRDLRYSGIPKEAKEELEGSIDRSITCGERVSGMIKAILDYSRMGKGELKPVVIKEAVEGFQQLIGPERKTQKVHLDVQLEESLPPILGDRIQFEQILVNFVRNAIHAVKHKPQEERNVTLKIFKKDYKTIRIECIDNGYGIEKKFLNDMFLANTTTKGSSEGTGMGLYIVRQTVTTFGGRVWGESEGKDKGACLIAELPIYDGDRIAKIDILKPKKEEKDGKDGQSKD